MAEQDIPLQPTEEPSASDSTAASSSTIADPIQEMQKLTDIETDLAETALAVASAPEVVPEQTGAAGAEDADAANSTLLETAQAVEDVLEQSIPAAPATGPSTAQETEIATTEVPTTDVSALTGDASASSAAVSEAVRSEPESTPDVSVHFADAPQAGPTSSDTADAVQQTLAAVQQDVETPILPPAAEDMAIETSQIADAQHIEVDETPVPVALPVPIPTPASLPVPNGGLPPRPSSAVIAEAQQSAQLPTSSVNPTPVLPVPVPTPLPQETLIDVELPEGLTPGSPSVAANPGLMVSWKQSPSDPMILLRLFNWAVQKTEIVDARAWYKALAKYEPTAVQPLLALMNLELALSNFSEVEGLFATALKGPSGGITAAADVSIWKAYLHYIRRQKSVAEGSANSDAVRKTITDAYEFALKECGTDRESGEIWQEYIAFLGEPTPKNTWDTQQQMDTLRRVYQRAVCIPLNNVEALWKAYDAFESGLNKLTAKKFLAEKSPSYMSARTALRELRALTDTLPKPILPPRPTFSDGDRQLVNTWKAYLKWEEADPLLLEDKEALAGRVTYALRKCLNETRHSPELWHYAANWYTINGQTEEAAGVLAAGVEACPTSILLTFALTEIEEDRKNYSKCHEAFEKLIAALHPEIEALKEQVAKEVETAMGPEIKQASGIDMDMSGDGLSEVQKLTAEREQRGKLVSERRGRDVDDLAAAAGVVWVMYMRFARRAEGNKAARAVFGKARKSPYPTWHTFESSAMMEYHANKDSSVAIRIFELGFKLFSEDVEYVVRYLQFLLSINDDQNARALFERSAVKIPADKARPLWDAWARYEYMFGDLSAVRKLEARFAEVFPNDSPLKRFAQRFTYNGLDQIALRDLGFGRRQPPAAPPQVQQQPQPLPHSLPSIPPPSAMPAPPPPMQAIEPPKRALPDSPRHSRPRGSVDRSRSPNHKRQRGASPRRFPGDRVSSGGGPPPRYGNMNRGSRDRSDPPQMMRRDDRGSLPPPILPPHAQMPPPGYGAPSPVVGPALDRSGVSRPLAWFISTLPPSRAFDGPVFRPDDIMGLVRNVNPAAIGGPPPPGPPGPPPPGRYVEPPRYGGPPPPRGRY